MCKGVKCDYIKNNLKSEIANIKLNGTIDEKEQIDKINKICEKTNTSDNYEKKRLVPYIDGVIPPQRIMSYNNYKRLLEYTKIKKNKENKEKYKK
jgi:hypothetical protein